MHAMMLPPVNRITMQLLTCQGEGRVSCDDVNKKEEMINALTWYILQYTPRGIHDMHIDVYRQLYANIYTVTGSHV